MLLEKKMEGFLYVQIRKDLWEVSEKWLKPKDRRVCKGCSNVPEKIQLRVCSVYSRVCV